MASLALQVERSRTAFEPCAMHPEAHVHEPLFPTAELDDLSSHAHRQLIGWLGFLLPALLWLIAGWRPTGPLPQWCLLDSVSVYYYTGAVTVFVGILVALGVFLFTYRGYDNEYRRRDRIAAIVAGGAAVLVAFFPTAPPDASLRPAWWTSPLGTIHYAAAVVLFGAFIYFSLFLFPRSKVDIGASLPNDKRRRNRVYRVCGAAMVACILWAGAAELRHAPIFWPETLALEFFAVSWLVKGRVGWTITALGHRVVHYGRHP